MWLTTMDDAETRILLTRTAAVGAKDFRLKGKEDAVFLSDIPPAFQRAYMNGFNTVFNQAVDSKTTAVVQ